MTRAPATRPRAGARLLCAAMLGALLAACTGSGGAGGRSVATTGSPSSAGTASRPASSSPTGPASTDGDVTSGGSPSSSMPPAGVTTGQSTASPAPSGTASTDPATRTSTPRPSTAPPASSRPPAANWWRPAVGLTWQWQLTGAVDLTVDAAVYDLDLFETDAATVSRLHALKRHVICYIDVGSWEDFRPDAGAFPAAVKGASNGWPGERWLDIRQLDVLRPLMTKRLQQCADKGFDGVEPDLMDGFSNATGFPLSAADQLRYNRMIAGIAHSLGLAVGLKGDPEQASVLVKDFDFAINEQCVEFGECDLLRPFIAAGKPVFHVEYALSPSEFCPVTRPLGFSSMRKHLELDAWREPC